MYSCVLGEGRGRAGSVFLILISISVADVLAHIAFLAVNSSPEQGSRKRTPRPSAEVQTPGLGEGVGAADGSFFSFPRPLTAIRSVFVFTGRSGNARQMMACPSFHTPHRTGVCLGPSGPHRAPAIRGHRVTRPLTTDRPGRLSADHLILT